jgi:methylmalonyl-CoA mutase
LAEGVKSRIHVPMSSSHVGLADWRTQVEAELKGVPFEKALVRTTAEGLRLEPLYVTAPVLGSFGRRQGAVQVCSRVERLGDVDEALTGGAEALWVDSISSPAAGAALASGRRVFVDDASAGPALCADPLSRRAHAGAAFDLDAAWSRVAGPMVVSSLPYHHAGAEQAEELACVLSAAVACLRRGVPANHLGFRLAVGQQTFLELAKLRALRVCWAKVLAASGLAPCVPLLHAVGSYRTLTQRDPWVNMVRATTQAFAALVGGADVVTVPTFDAAFGVSTTDSRRLARNTVLMLRDESHLAHFVDAAAGAYAFDTLTDAIAREAWQRFTQLEAQGGLAAQLIDGRLAERLAMAWASKQQAVATRRHGVVGVSEFANLEEQLPAPLPKPVAVPPGALPRHTDAEAIESLRLKAETTQLRVQLLTLGGFAESRARVGFAKNVFAAAGLPTEETATVGPCAVVCLCGTDERYASEAVATAEALRAAGAQFILVAGKPGPLESALRAAGVQQFLFVGCDVVNTVSAVLKGVAK